MTAARASLALLAATAALAATAGASSASNASHAGRGTPKAPDAADAPVASGSRAGHRPKASAARRAGAKHRRSRGRAAKRVRWRSSTRALQSGVGRLIGGGAFGPGTPGSSQPGGGPIPIDPGAVPPTPPLVFHALSVQSREFSLTLSRSLLTAGLETVQLNNRGEDPHDLVISPEDSHDPLAEFPETASEQTHTLQVNLAAGRYRLWCSLPGHEASGMKATLTVQ